MTTYLGTLGNDKIVGSIDAMGQNIDARDGDDFVTLGSHQIYISGPGADTVVGNGASDYALWPAPNAGLVDLSKGYAFDGYGYRDAISGISTVHGNGFGITVIGSAANEIVFIFGGPNTIDLSGGVDTVRYWDLKFEDYSVKVQSDQINVTNKITGRVDTLRGVEVLEFWTQSVLEKRIDVEELQSISQPSAFSIQTGQVVENSDANGNPRWVITSLNGDAFADLALRFDPNSAFETGKIGYSPIRFYLGSASGKYTPAPLTMSDSLAPTLVNRIVTADFNNDGLGDIVIGASGQDPYENGKPVGPTPGEPSYVLMSAPSGYKSLKIPDIPSIFAHHVSLGDINADGFQDVFIDSIGFGSPSDFKRPFSYFLVGQPGGLFSVDRSRLPDMIRDAAFITVSPLADGKTIYNTNTYTSSVIFDCNGDGFKDLAVLPIGGTQQGMVFLNDGTGNFSDQRKVILPPGPYGSGYLADFTDGRQETFGSIYLDTKAIDINQDGRLDLVSIVTKDSRVGSNYEFYRGAAVQVLVNTPHGFVDETSSRVSFTHTPDTNYSHYDTVEVTDFNADGFSDVVIYRGLNNSYGASNTRILLNDGTGIFTDTPFPKGIPKGLLICVDPTVGRYVLISQAGTSYAADGSPNYMIRVDGVDFDWSKGLDLFTGEARPSGKQLSDIPGRWLHGASGNDELVLSTGHERGFGYDGNDSFRGLEGSDSLDGGDGIDTAIFEKARSAYKTEKLIQDNTTLWKVTDLATGDVDELRNIERLRFSDKSLAIDLDGNAGTTAKILGAAFGKAAVANGVYGGIGLHYLDNLSYSYEQLIGLAINAALGPTPTNGQVVDLLYKNVVGVLPDAATKAMFVGMLDRKEQSIGSLGVLAAETDLNKTNIDLVGLAKTGLEYLPFQS